MDILAIVLRVLHIGAAVAVAGGAFFQLVALGPPLSGLPDEQRRSLRERIVSRWRGVVVAAIVLLLISGMLNFMLFKLAAYREHPRAGLYHAIFGVKFLAALLAFALALLLTLRGSRFERIRARAGTWLTYLTGLLALVIVLGAVLGNFTRLFGAVA